MSKTNLQHILDSVDVDARENFASMDSKDQMLVIFSLEMSNSSRLAVVEKKQIDFEREYTNYRRNRERMERERKDDTLSTTQKIITELAKQFNFWFYFRDRILPPILTAIALGILYVVFSGKIP